MTAREWVTTMEPGKTGGMVDKLNEAERDGGQNHGGQNHGAPRLLRNKSPIPGAPARSGRPFGGGARTRGEGGLGAKIPRRA
jgi:hypothetical protein